MEELYNKLVEAGDYTKSFEEFVEQYGDAEKSQKLYEGLSSEGGYTKSFEEFKSQYGFGEKKNPIVTPSDGVEEVTESITEVETPLGSSDGLEATEVVEDVVEPVVDFNEQISPISALKEDTEELQVYINEDLDSILNKAKDPNRPRARGNITFTKTGRAIESQGPVLDLSIDEQLRLKIESDPNIQKALSVGYIKKSDVTKALKGDVKSIEKLQELSVKSVEDNMLKLQSEEFQPYDVYSEKQNYIETEEDKSITQNAVNLVTAFDAETKTLIDANPNATEEEMEAIFNREGAPTEEQYDIAENSDYQQTGFEDEDLGRMYDQEALKKLSDKNEKFSIAGFNGYLNKKGFKENYNELLENETISENGVSYDYSGNYNPSLAAERLKYDYLKNYLAEADMQRIEKEVLDYKIENNGRNPFLHGDTDKINLNPSVKTEDLNQYMAEEFKSLAAVVKKQKLQTKENYQTEIEGGSGGSNSQWILDMGSQGGRSVNDRINSFSEGAYGWVGMDSVVDEIQMNQAETELNRDDMLRYTYASGKSAFANGREYLIDDRGEIYDLDLKIRVSGVLEPSQIEEIRKQVSLNGVETSSFSGTGAAVTTAGVASDMLLQIALTRGVGMAGQTVKGIAAASKYKQGRNIISLLEQVPMKASTASAMIAQGTLMGTSLSSDVRKQALAAGMSDEEANELAASAGMQGYALGVITAPISTQKIAMDKIFGTKVKEKLIQKTIDTYAKGAGIEASKNIFKKGLDGIIRTVPVYLKEGGKEFVQENIQQAGQAYVIGSDINEQAAQEIMKDTISMDDFWNTSIISVTAGMLMPFAGDVQTGAVRAYKMRGKGFQAVDQMKALALMANDSDKTKELLDSQVKKGVYTQEQVDNIMADVDIYKSTVNGMPPNLSAETSLLVMSDLAEIKKLEAQKANQDPAFAFRNDAKIFDLKNRIIKNSNFDFINNKSKQKLMDTAAKELVAEKEAAGEKNYSIDNSQIRAKAVENFNKLSQEEMQAIAFPDQEKESETKTETDAVQKPSTEKQVLPNDATSQTDGADSEVELQQVGEGDVGTDTETKVEEGDTQTDTTIDTTTETDVEQLTETTSETEVMSVNKERVDSIVDGIVEKTKSRNVGESTNPQKVADNAIEYIKGSKLFEQATDIERESIIREVSSKLGVEIKPPTAKKLLGIKRIGKPTTIKVKSDYAAMKKDLQKEAKVARDAKNDVNKRRKGLQGAIDLVLKAGNITTKKANTLLKKVSNVNLYNAKKVQDVLDFTTRAMNDAEYSNKLDKAKKLQKSIKTKLKGKEAGLSDSAKKFTEVNPSNVSDIDSYLEKAEAVSKGLQPTRKPSKGDLKVSKPFDIKKTDEYSKKETELEAERNYELAKESFQELTGLEPGDLTLDQMKEMLYEVDGKETNSEADTEMLKKKETVIDKAVNNAFKNTKINIKGAIEAGDIELSKSQKTLISNFLNMDLSLMTTKQKMEALDSIVNFELNQSTGGMEAVLMKQVGAVKLNRVKNKGVKSADNKSLFGLGKFWNKQIATLPNVFELTFKSQQKARMVMEALGLDGIINGSAKAQNESARVEKDYANTFAKKKMQDGIYFDESNDIERGILADVRRVTPGTESEQQKEFDDSKNLIKETYERLISSGDKLKVSKGEVIKAQYDNLLKDSNSISDVESKADPVNLDGVKYVTEIWAEKYTELSDTSLNVYNKNLGKDINYTPRNIQTIKETENERDITQPVFNPEGITRKNAYDKKTGVLKEATKPSTLSKGKVLNLSFDAQNMSNYKAALTDIYTAPSIQQVKGARESKAFNEVFTNESAKEIINDRINSYVDSKRGKKYVDGSTKRALNRLNKVATLGVSRVLGGPTQFIKQIVPIFNTGANAGVGNTLKGAKLIFDADVQKAIDNSGLPIANRGIQSQSDIENADSRIKKKAQTKAGRVIDAADSINKKTLEAFLVYPDVQTARASFIAYYIQQMKKDGGDTSNIDWSKPLDKKAAQYAQQQVDRQQNTSDQDLQGDLFTNQNFGSQMVRKTLFPFANFLLNQKTRMYSDINTLTNNPTALPGDKTRALRSLGGLGVETVMFNAIGLGITQTLAAAARLISGEEEDPNLSSYKNAEERSAKREKEFEQRLTGRLGNMVADILVPIPILNDESLNQINGLMSMFQEDEDNPFQFFAKTDKKIIDQLGTLGIGPKKAVILADMIKTVITGEKTTVFMGRESTKKINPEKLNALKLTTMAYAMHAIGVPILNSSEVGYVSERAFKDIGKSKVIEEKVDYEAEAKAKLKQRGINNPSKESIDFESKQLKRVDQGKERKTIKTNSKSKSDKSFNPGSFGSGKSKSKSSSFKPKSF